MKKLPILFCLMMLMKIMCFSQTTLTHSDSCVLITPQQLKTTNIIFAQHNELQQENEWLNAQLFNYELVLDNTYEIDSLRCKELEMYNEVLTTRNQQITDLKKRIKVWQFAGGTSLISCVGLVICLMKLL